MPPSRLTSTQWLICGIAALGFAFDIYELLMAPLIVGPAIGELLHTKPGEPTFNTWVGLFFWVPAICGGVFGLIGGYLTDRFGRRRVLTWSILIYAFSAFFAGFAEDVITLLVLRSLTFVGVCVEFVAATAWLAELFPEPKRREAVLGYTQAFSSIGGVMVTGAYALIVTYAHLLPAIGGGHSAWRYTLMSGVLPALPLIVIRPFLPESPTWRQKKETGTLKRPSLAAIFTPEFRKTTIVTTIMFACVYGAAFGAIQQMPRIVPGLPEVRTLAPQQQQQTASLVQGYQEFGGLAGRFALAYLAVRMVSRRKLLRTFMVPAMIVFPLVFGYAGITSLSLAKWGMALAGFFMVAQFSFWGNYLPRMYPTHLRGTGEAFAANIGGRMLGTSFAFVTTQLSNTVPGTTPSMRLAYAATLVAVFVWVVGFVCSFFLPEPASQELPE